MSAHQIAKSLLESRYLYWLFLMIAVGSAFLSYHGFKPLIPGTEGKTIAAVLAVILGVGLYLFHTINLKVLTSSAPLPNRLGALALAVAFFLVGIVGFSSGPNVAAIAGKPAQQVHLERYLQSVSHTTAATFQQSLDIRQFLPLLQQEANSWAQAGENELKYGTYSGFPSSGSVKRVLDNYALQFEQLHQDIKAFIQQNQTINQQAQQTLSHLRAILIADQPIKLRINQATEPLNKLQNLLAQMRGQVLAQSLGFAVTGLPNELELITLSANPKIAKGQRQAITKIKAKLTKSTQLLSSILSQYGQSKPPEFPELKPISTLSAVFTYWYVFPTAWMAGVGLDLLPLMLAVFLLVLDCGTTPRSRAQARLMDMPAIDLIAAKKWEEAMRRQQGSNEALHKITEEQLGLTFDEEKDDDKERQ